MNDSPFPGGLRVIPCLNNTPRSRRRLLVVHIESLINQCPTAHNEWVILDSQSHYQSREQQTHLQQSGGGEKHVYHPQEHHEPGVGGKMAISV